MDHPFAHLRSRGDVFACCKDPVNLDIAKPAEDRMVATCQKCGRRHTKLRADPGMIGAFRGAVTLDLSKLLQRR